MRKLRCFVRKSGPVLLLCLCTAAGAEPYFSLEATGGAAVGDWLLPLAGFRLGAGWEFGSGLGLGAEAGFSGTWEEGPAVLPLAAVLSYRLPLSYRLTLRPAIQLETDAGLDGGLAIVPGQRLGLEIAGPGSAWAFSVTAGAVFYIEDRRFTPGFALAAGLAFRPGGPARQRTEERPAIDRAGEQDWLLALVVEQARETLAGEIKARLEARPMTEGGKVRISLTNIRFPPDSADLPESEHPKLDEAAAILRGLPGRRILVTGHTALAGSTGARMYTSLERAQAVADWLVQAGARGADEIAVQGCGAETPAADNATPEGMACNRRAEITILED